MRSSIWIKDLVDGVLSQISDVSMGTQRYVYSNWTGDGQTVTFFRNTRTPLGKIEVQIARYSLKDKLTTTVDALSNVMSVAYAPLSGNIVAAWTTVDLELFQSGSRGRLLELVQWTTTYTEYGQLGSIW